MRKVFIIAEAGVNHNGDIEIAKKLIDAAKDANADAVKFQTFVTENIVSRKVEKAKYQKDTIGDEESQFEMLKKLELDVDIHRLLINYCKKKNIMFLSTPFDHDSISMLNKLGLEIFKIPSGELTNLPYLKHIGSLNKKVILSTGMANIGEVEDSLNVLIESGTKRDHINILHANTEYPTPMEDVNLNAMVTLGNTFKVKFGYSDHTLGIEVPIAAVALGAEIIEKHFTLDKTLEGPDHKASLEPSELNKMVKSIRNIEIAMGDGIKQTSPSEEKNKPIARKSIVAQKKISKGEMFTSENIAIKRPGTGISPMRWEEVIGKISNQDFNKDDLIIL